VPGQDHLSGHDVFRTTMMRAAELHNEVH
jgi:hypothetical protein